MRREIEAIRYFDRPQVDRAEHVRVFLVHCLHLDSALRTLFLGTSVNLVGIDLLCTPSVDYLPVAEDVDRVSQGEGTVHVLFDDALAIDRVDQPGEYLVDPVDDERRAKSK